MYIRSGAEVPNHKEQEDGEHGMWRHFRVADWEWRGPRGVFRKKGQREKEKKEKKKKKKKKDVCLLEFCSGRCASERYRWTPVNVQRR
ncbi:predicted protein [Botrytis cinerea T4]|uniref:Uncharacterized protein n=1 Tax=Botryotinia fuckeliana (strain T4) TaxID=999810 RepID=G2XPL5_BOTF4|nr:predicted protein [Botrytis cinerea T4]